MYQSVLFLTSFSKSILSKISEKFWFGFVFVYEKQKIEKSFVKKKGQPSQPNWASPASRGPALAHPHPPLPSLSDARHPPISAVPMHGSSPAGPPSTPPLQSAPPRMVMAAPPPPSYTPPPPLLFAPIRTNRAPPGCPYGSSQAVVAAVVLLLYR